MVYFFVALGSFGGATLRFLIKDVILEVLVKHLQDEYKKLMQVLWA